MHMHGYPRDARSRRASRSSSNGVAHHVSLTGLGDKQSSINSGYGEEVSKKTQSSNTGVEGGDGANHVSKAETQLKGRLERAIGRLFHSNVHDTSIVTEQ